MKSQHFYWFTQGVLLAGLVVNITFHQWVAILPTLGWFLTNYRLRRAQLMAFNKG